MMLLLGYRVKGRVGQEAQVSHFLFMDDTLGFCVDSWYKMVHLSSFLMWF